MLAIASMDLFVVPTLSFRLLFQIMPSGPMHEVNAGAGKLSYSGRDSPREV
jgi:hypothetical protein